MITNGNMIVKKDSMAQRHARNGYMKHFVIFWNKIFLEISAVFHVCDIFTLI